MRIAILLLLSGIVQDRTTLPEKLDRAALQKCKAGTVFVLVKGEGWERTGSGFFVSESGHIITNRHVVEGAGSVEVITASGQDDQKRTAAKVSLLHDSIDLALLHIDAANTPALVLGDAAALQEADSLWSFGYPLGEAIGKSGRGPEITVNRGGVTSLRKGRDGALEAIQTDAQVNPGNSGGPLVSGDGRVFGVVTFGIKDTSLRFAIPPAVVRSFLAGRLSDVAAAPETLEVGGGRVTIRARVSEVLGKCERVWAVIDGKEIAMTKQGDLWSATWDAPALSREERDAQELTLRSRDGKETRAPFQPIVFKIHHAYGVLTIPSSEVSEVRFGGEGKPDVVRTRKGTFEGTFEPRSLDVGGAGVEVKTLSSIDLLPCQGRRHAILVKAKAGADEIGAPPASVWVGRPARPQPADGGRFDVRLDAAEVEKKMPALISDAKLAAGGRILAIHFKSLKTLGLFDLAKLEFVKHIQLADEEIVYAAGRTRLLICYPSTSRMERWSLTSLEKDLTVESPVSGPVRNLEMGWNSDAVAIIRWSRSAQTASGDKTELLDVERCRLIESQESNGRSGDLSGYSRAYLRMAPDGSAAGGWRAGVSPSGLVLIRIGEKSLEWKYQHDSVGYVVPSENGACVFTQNGLYAGDEIAIVNNKERDRAWTLPMSGGTFYLALAYTPAETKASIHLLSSKQKLLTLPKPLFEKTEWNMHAQPDNDFTMDKRVLALPAAKLLILLPPTNDRLVLRRLDLDAILAESGIDYLFVESSPPTSASVGTAWSYEPTIRSKRGQLKLRLEVAPDGMRLAGTVLTWTPAAAGTFSTVLVCSDASGQETYHTFKVTVK